MAFALRARVLLRIPLLLGVLLLTVNAAPARAAFDVEHMLAATDGAMYDYLGSSVAYDGDSAVVGAEGDDYSRGSAYVFTRSGGVWTQQQKLTASDGTAGDYFGSSVAIAGDTAVVGAEEDGVGANSDQGSAYVFTRSGGAWTQQQKLTASDGTAYDYFGSSVALDGNTAVVGAEEDDVGARSDQGSAYVFTRSGGVWTQQQKLTASDAAADDYFGSSVALDGDTAAVGARYGDGDDADQGSAYVFTRSGATWTQQQKLTASDGATNDRFGDSVALDGDTAVVGAGYDDVAANAEGSAYVFTRSGATWTQQQKLTASDGTAEDRFGDSVALDGDTAVVGAPLDYFYEGSAYVFTRSGTTWTQQQKLTASDGATDDSFGTSVALDGDTAVVGASGNDLSHFGQGSAYVYQPDQPPGAVDDRATVAEDAGATAIDVLANDNNADGGPMTIASSTDGAHGMVAITDGGADLTYAPAPDYFGPDSFTYTLNGGSTATVSVTVTAVDDPPLAVDDSATVAEDSGASVVDVLANDTDVDGGTMTIVSKTNGSHGSVAITDGGADLTYAPAPDYFGSDSFTYTLNEGSTATVSVTVTNVPDIVPDTIPPETKITRQPKKTVRTDKTKVKAIFEFTSSEPGSSFAYKLDDEKEWRPCTSPEKLRVKRGKHTFSVRATDAAGNPDPTPAVFKWKVKKREKG